MMGVFGFDINSLKYVNFVPFGAKSLYLSYIELISDENDHNK